MLEKPPTINNQEKELFDFEQWLSSELPRQYEEKAKILNRLGLLEILPEKKEIGIVGIDGQEYPIPEQEDIEKIIKENREMFEEKMKQGFTELEIVPFGLPLERLIKTAGKIILKHHQEEKLFSAKQNPEDETEELEPLKLYDDCATNPAHSPIYAWEEYSKADTEGKLVYHPKEFSRNRQGKTKEQVLRETGQGFNIILREKNINIPRQGKGEIIGGRKQLEANQTPNEYLKTLQTEKPYRNEQGQTPEDWLTLFISHLEKHNQIVDDYQGKSSIAYNLGAFFAVDGGVPYSFWYRADRRAILYGRDPGSRDGDYGARGRVRVI